MDLPSPKMNPRSPVHFVVTWRIAAPLESANPTRFDLLKHLAAIREYQLDRKEDALEAWEGGEYQETSNAFTNDAMLAINQAMGFQHEFTATLVEARSSDVEEFVAAGVRLFVLWPPYEDREMLTETIEHYSNTILPHFDAGRRP